MPLFPLSPGGELVTAGRCIRTQRNSRLRYPWYAKLSRIQAILSQTILPN